MTKIAPDLGTLRGRRSFLKRTVACLGGPWPPAPVGDDAVLERREADGYGLEKVRYPVESDETVDAWVLVPAAPPPVSGYPAVAVWHQHNNQYECGKSEPAGLAGDPSQATAIDLVHEGFLVLCPDAAGFEDRRSPDLTGGDFERFLFLDQLTRGRCLAWKNILDMKRAVDYLTRRPDVDTRRMGCCGHSLGSTFSWLLGPFEPRLRGFVGNCCLPTYGMIRENHLIHSFSNFVPGLERYGDIPHLAGLIAPRFLHLNFGAGDPLNPVASVERALPTIAEIYAANGSPEAFTWYIDPGAGHEISENMKRRIIESLKKFLA